MGWSTRCSTRRARTASTTTRTRMERPDVDSGPDPLDRRPPCATASPDAVTHRRRRRLGRRPDSPSTCSSTSGPRRSPGRARSPRPSRSSTPPASSGLRIAPQGSRPQRRARSASLDEHADPEARADEGRRARRRRRAVRGSRPARAGGTSSPQASEAGLAALHGSSPEINVTGYSLGGGVGWMARKHGLQTNRLTAIEIVTADGEHRRVDADNEPELFWALRGGGGNFGVVTAIEFELDPGARVLRRNAVLPVRARRRGPARLARVDRGRARRDHLGRPHAAAPGPRDDPRDRARQVVRDRRGDLLGAEADGVELLAPLRELGPEHGHVRDGAADRARAPAHGPDRPGPVPDGTHAMLGELSAGRVDEDLAVAGPGSGSPLSLELRHMGGALARSDAEPRRARHAAAAST